jgi:ATP-dependent protease Clp ATPase subunit
VTEGRSKFRCSFCGHHQDDVDRLIAGPRAFICDQCVEGCAANFSGGSRWDIPTRAWVEHAPSPRPHQRQSHFGDDVSCSFCGKAEPDLQWLVGCREPSTFICDECVGLFQMIVREPPIVPSVKPGVSKDRLRQRFRWPWQPPHVDRALRP